MLVLNKGARNKAGNSLPKIVIGAVCAQWKRCGKPNCKCARGELHGAYYYLFWQEGGRQRKAYIRREDEAAARAAYEERKRMRASLRVERALGRNQWRALIDQYRSLTG